MADDPLLGQIREAAEQGDAPALTRIAYGLYFKLDDAQTALQRTRENLCAHLAQAHAPAAEMAGAR